MNVLRPWGWGGGWAACAMSAALLASGLAAPAAARENDTREFSAQEQARLEAGKLVVRKQQVARGEARYVGGFAWQVIDADAAVVWKALSDVNAYKHFLPAVSSARSMDLVGYDRRVRIEHDTPLMKTSYFVLTRMDSPTKTFAFRLDHTRPSAITDAWGELRVTPYLGGKCVVSLAIMADLGSGLVARLMRGQVHDWMLRIPEQLKRYVERKLRQK